MPSSRNSNLFPGWAPRILGRMKDSELKRLFDLIETLRGENGCPWDRDQKARDILSDLVEETCELQWAYEQGEAADTLEELGDVIFVLVFAMQLLAEEYPNITLERASQDAYDKIKRRHPHVFGDEVARSKQEGLGHWNRMKQEEKRARAKPQHIFDDIAGSLSPVRRAEKIQRRAARVGFDWPDTSGIFAKIREEVDELEHAFAEGHNGQREEELGDLLFSVLNLTRFVGVEGEKALSGTNAKFIKRFVQMEALAKSDGRALTDMTLEEMDKYWEQAKKAD
jgi:tetrapyrrole methylase family protein/MazG family protein